MAIKIDDELLIELGLGSLTPEEKKKLSVQIFETLQMRVGTRLADQMSEEQLDEFEEFIDSDDKNGALKWLQSNFPQYPKVVQEEFEKLKAEIKKDSAKILEAAK